MRVRTLFVFFCTICSICFSSNLDPQEQSNLIENILSSGNECVIGIVEDKIYIDPNKIFPDENGLFLQLAQGYFVAIQELLADRDGCYLALSRKITKKCPHCDAERLSGAFSCPNPKCPSREPKKEPTKNT